MPPKSLGASPPSRISTVNSPRTAKAAAIATTAARRLSSKSPAAGPHPHGSHEDHTLFTAFERVTKWPIHESAVRLEILDEALACFNHIMRVEMLEVCSPTETDSRNVLRHAEQLEREDLRDSYASAKVSVEHFVLAKEEQICRQELDLETANAFVDLIRCSIRLHVSRVLYEESKVRERLQSEEAENRNLLRKQRSINGNFHDSVHGIRRLLKDDSEVPDVVLGAIYRRSSRQMSHSKAAELQQKIITLVEREAVLSRIRERTWQEQRDRANAEHSELRAEVADLKAKIRRLKKKGAAAKCAALQEDLSTKKEALDRVKARIARYEEMDRREEDRRQRNLLPPPSSAGQESDSGSVAKNTLTKHMERQIELIREKEQRIIDENVRRMIVAQENERLREQGRAAIAVHDGAPVFDAFGGHANNTPRSLSKNPSRQSSATRRPSGGGWGAPEEEHHGGPSPRPPQPRKDSAASMRHRVSVDGGQHSRSTSASRRQSWLPEPSSGGSPSARRASRSYEPEDEAESSRPSGDRDAGKKALAEARARRATKEKEDSYSSPGESAGTQQQRPRPWAEAMIPEDAPAAPYSRRYGSTKGEGTEEFPNTAEGRAARRASRMLQSGETEKEDRGGQPKCEQVDTEDEKDAVKRLSRRLQRSSRESDSPSIPRLREDYRPGDGSSEEDSDGGQQHAEDEDRTPSAEGRQQLLPPVGGSQRLRYNADDDDESDREPLTSSRVRRQRSIVS
jgi:hypothetical protein